MSTWHFCVLEHFEQIFKTIQMRVSAKEMDARSRARDMYFCLVLYDFSYIVSAFLLGTQHILSHKSQFAGVCVCVRANKFDIEYISFALCRIQFMYERRQNHTLTLSLSLYMNICFVDVHSTTYLFNTAVIIPFVRHQPSTLHF